MTNASNPRPKRKRTPRRNKTGKPNKAASDTMKAFWQDPERVSKWREKHEAQMAARKADPDKSWSRRGIPDGMTREQAETMWAKAEASAKETTAALVAQGYLSTDDSFESRLAKEALENAITLMRTGYSMRVRINAARLVLEFTKGKPTRKRGITVRSAEDWLNEIAALPPRNNANTTTAETPIDAPDTAAP